MILRHYASTVADGFAALGEDQLEAYLETTDPDPVRVVDAVLIRDEIPPGNPRRW